MMFSRFRSTALCLSLAAVCSFSACKKDDTGTSPTTNTGPTPPKCRITKAVNQDWNGEATYTYQNGFLKQINFSNATPGSVQSIIYNYSSLGRVSQRDVIVDGKTYTRETYTYNGDGTVKHAAYYSAATGTFQEEEEFEYVYKDGKNIRRNRYDPNSGTDNGYTTFEYDSRGNMTKAYVFISSGSMSTLTEIYQLSYDDKQPGDVPDEVPMKYAFGRKNNITSFKYLDAKGNLVEKYDMQYTYNTNGFPTTTKVIMNDEPDPLLSIAYEYDCN